MAARGELEQRVLEVLWDSDAAMRVGDVLEALKKERELAYTTVMTVLDRLAKKNLVTRELHERAWYYQPALSQSELAAREILSLLQDLRADVRMQTLKFVTQRLSDEERQALGRQ